MYSTNFAKKYNTKTKPATTKPYIKHVVVKKPRQNHNWSKFQLDIFEWVKTVALKNVSKTGKKHVFITARAGCGKTSILVESLYTLKDANPEATAVFVAFSKKIQQELETRVPEGYKATTMHSMGFSALRAYNKNIAVDFNKGMICAAKALGLDPTDNNEIKDNKDIMFLVQKGASLSKMYLATTKEEVVEIFDRHELDLEDIEDEFGDVIYTSDDITAAVLKAMSIAKADTNKTDYDDMIYLPVVLGLKPTQVDWLFVDEVQDLNKAQQKLAISALKKNGHMVFVGDPFQAIQAFAGALSNSTEVLVKEMDADTLPLSVTYRCGKKIVELAQTLVPDYQYGPNNPDGEVVEGMLNDVYELAKPNDFVISRVNAPLVSLCFGFLKRGIPASIIGRDFADALVKFITKLAGKKIKDIPKLIEKCNTWKEREIQRLESANKPIDMALDKVECVIALCEGKSNVAELITSVQKIFAEEQEKGKIVLSSGHRAKGLESDRVFVLKDTFKPGMGDQEANVLYVSYTRAKSYLCLLNGKKI